ncbi:hypothetical protein [Pseudonocardia zijingensis]|uniref:hypothetical protein n=1 Tax=Pseudonocardia zijingensis TaxID=153376 RepID=UPI0031DC1D9E
MERFEQDGRFVSREEVHAAVDDLDPHTVDQALRRLSTTGYIAGRGTARSAVVAIVGVPEKGLRAAGFWPSRDEAIDRMLRALEEQAESETDPARRTKLRTVLASLREGGREVVIDVASAMIQAGVGLG